MISYKKKKKKEKSQKKEKKKENSQKKERKKENSEKKERKKENSGEKKKMMAWGLAWIQKTWDIGPSGIYRVEKVISHVSFIRS